VEIQHFRADQDRWDAGLAQAEGEGRTLSWVMRRLLDAYLDRELVIDVEGRIAVLQPEQRNRLNG
jgi:hypothetical protein